ncbi:27222_t:CDS:10 [Gigaspora margarita]|uniref:27222_t:CDS:1 n=1 Tax=Gigaspora margarita TaxID=4874 RepID=A0ABN7UI74_GIGMA|nr:27222_t:CDS:10 [Gigaspora margarita]
MNVLKIKESHLLYLSPEPTEEIWALSPEERIKKALEVISHLHQVDNKAYPQAHKLENLILECSSKEEKTQLEKQLAEAKKKLDRNKLMALYEAMSFREQGQLEELETERFGKIIKDIPAESLCRQVRVGEIPAKEDCFYYYCKEHCRKKDKAQFWYKGKEHLPELAQEIAEKGKCGGCLMPVYVIEQEHEAGNMRLNHLICGGCHKACDGGVYKRENDYYSFRHPKYINSVKKPEGEDFYLCVSCEEKHCQKYLNQCKSCQELFCSDCGEEDYCRDCQPDTTECLYCGKIVLTEETDSDEREECEKCEGTKSLMSLPFKKMSIPNTPIKEISNRELFQIIVQKLENSQIYFEGDDGKYEIKIGELEMEFKNHNGYEEELKNLCDDCSRAINDFFSAYYNCRTAAQNDKEWSFDLEKQKFIFNNKPTITVLTQGEISNIQIRQEGKNAYQLSNGDYFCHLTNLGEFSLEKKVERIFSKEELKQKAAAAYQKRTKNKKITEMLQAYGEMS